MQFEPTCESPLTSSSNNQSLARKWNKQVLRTCGVFTSIAYVTGFTIECAGIGLRSFLYGMRVEAEARSYEKAMATNAVDLTQEPAQRRCAVDTAAGAGHRER